LPRRRTRTPFPRSLAPIPTRGLGQRKIAMSGHAVNKDRCGWRRDQW
jgi:hypothetical protein